MSGHLTAEELTKSVDAPRSAECAFAELGGPGRPYTAPRGQERPGANTPIVRSVAAVAHADRQPADAAPRSRRAEGPPSTDSFGRRQKNARAAPVPGGQPERFPERPPPAHPAACRVARSLNTAPLPLPDGPSAAARCAVADRPRRRAPQWPATGLTRSQPSKINPSTVSPVRQASKSSGAIPVSATR
jgi:hypothetical protein